MFKFATFAQYSRQDDAEEKTLDFGAENRKLCSSKHNLRFSAVVSRIKLYAITKIEYKVCILYSFFVP